MDHLVQIKLVVKSIVRWGRLLVLSSSFGMSPTFFHPPGWHTPVTIIVMDRIHELTAFGWKQRYCKPLRTADASRPDDRRQYHCLLLIAKYAIKSNHHA